MKKILLASLMLAACASTPEFLRRVEWQGEAGPLEVTAIQVAQENELLRVEARIENTKTDPTLYRYRVRWLNAEGFQIWGDEVWKPMPIQGKEQQQLISTAPSPKATDFRLVIARDPR